MNERFDYVVLGGGSAGCVVAGRLAHESDAKVLVLEAGPAAEAYPETLSADGYKYAFANDRVMWERFTVPQRHSEGQRFFVGTGSVSGGSGSVNGMVYTRGAKQDYAEWPQGWRWDDVVPDFERLEARLRPRRRAPTRWTEACISAAVACGMERREDLNDGMLSNVVGYEWMTYEGGDRRSSYVAFVKEPGPRDNLVFRNGARVHRIVFDERKRAVAVEYEHDGVNARVEVDREVVLCAGALETPKLLMLSGIGPDQALRAAGISPVHTAAAIGQNLHDHPNVPLFFVSRGLVDCQYPQLYSFYRTRPQADLPPGQSDTCYVFWPAPSAMKQAMQRMLPGKVLPASMYDGPLKQAIRSGLDLAFGIGATNRIVEHLYGIVVILGKPKSRGSVRLGSGDPRTPVVVDPAYFSDPEDMDTMVDGIAFARRLSKAGGLGAWRSQELMPGAWNQSREALAKWVGKNAITTYHFAGTARMGESPSAAVDTRLRLRGVTGVRIADASAVPFTPVSAMNAPSMLVGYRAAGYCLDERG
ncbi:MAG: GMC family oxidoreductase [Deltaproteobacteria bacterium]|nr:GMC family oxidoreductase [Deltaproteobacteria bacterium]MBK8717410.1 GMC family oxidoreductase [Deltaproteobacteria bacterium]MBP7286277.1 GMC family oxidoreductase [Nannocystaceae bacterium]